MQENYTDINSKTIDSWIEEGWEWGRPISREEFSQAQKGHWNVGLTPIKPVPKSWFGDLKNKKLLGLASGGGQQMPIFAALGADCTVLDYSDKQLASEEFVAKREGYEIKIVKADMTKKFPFDDSSFDIIFHPVSNCYIEDVNHVWNECFRVLKTGGILLAGLDNGLNFLFDDDEENDSENWQIPIKHKLPFNPLKDKQLFEKMKAENYGIQFSHTLEEQIGGQLKAGFTLKDLYEDYNSSGALKDVAPAFFATFSIKL